MNKKIILTIVACVAAIGIVFVSSLPTIQNRQNMQPQNFILQNVTEETSVENYSSILLENERGQTLLFKNDTLYFQLMSMQISGSTHYSILPKKEYFDLYQKVRYNPASNTVFVYPIFTQAAYDHNGFYDFYSGKCDEKCISIPIQYNIGGAVSTSSMIGTSVLTFLGYPYITDIDIDKNPDILKKYDRVIMLHSEYVTQKEFDAVTNHPNVLYLYPNAMYAQVATDYDKNTLTLIRGHGYPDSSIKNGFGWKFDNSPLEYDRRCDNWSLSKIDNGQMLNCTPGMRMLYDEKLLMTIRG